MNLQSKLKLAAVLASTVALGTILGAGALALNAHYEWTKYKQDNECNILGYGIKMPDGSMLRILQLELRYYPDSQILTEFWCSKTGEVMWF